MTNAFAITGPAVLNVSGGRTSALMLRRVLDAHGGTLPRDVPGSLAWWAAQEQRVGATFVKGRRYLDVIADAARAPLPGMFDEAEVVPISCHCTDRRRVRCRCGARRGQGHALACPVVMERWAA